MGVFDTIKKEIVTIGSLVMIIVILSLVLLKFKTSNVGDAMCTGSANLYFNTSSEVCCLGTATTATSNCLGANTSAISSIGAGINTTVSAIDEPISWIAIVVVAIVGIMLVKWFTKSKM